METAWHTKESEEVLKILDTSERGLATDEAEWRLARDGANELPEVKPEGIFRIFIRQFENPLIYILAAAAVIVFIMGETADGSMILIVLILNAIVGAFQEGRAENTLRALKNFVHTRAVVLRDGKEHIIPYGKVVAGDIILIQSGDKVPADARIIEANNLKLDEAALTGESKPVSKFSDSIDDAGIPILEQKNMLFKGTDAVAGEAKAVVVSTGANTAIGKIASQIASIHTEIPLASNIRNLSRLIITATLLISIVIFIGGIRTGSTALEMFTVVVSVAVSVIPEGLPIAVTLILATGVWRMSKRNALVKRLQAVETLGQASVIAVDKTGTLTKNEMVIQEVFIDGQLFEIGGVGYEPEGQASLKGKSINPPDHPGLLLSGKIAAFCANARTLYNESTGEWRVTGDPTEAAMFVLGQKLGFNKDVLENTSPLIGEIPFAYKLKYHVMVHQDKGKKLMTVVGAPEVILELCTQVWHENGARAFQKDELDNLNEKFLELSRRGLRVLAFAITEDVPNDIEPESIKSLTFAGFYGMKDALRDEVKPAIRQAMDAGIRVVMITGDYKATAEALASEALIYKDGDLVLTGEDVDMMSDQSLKEALPKVSVFARVTPEHKLRIINTYKSIGEIVAMTGDGVNDAPSLVAADLGVSMGKIGTEVAKEASDIVLLDDNFRSIVSAIEEGRSIYKNIKKVVLYLVSTSIGEVLVITLAIFIGLPLPLLPAQIIWLNFVTDGFLDIALAMEPKEKRLLEKGFSKPAKYLVDLQMTKRIFLMAVPMMIGTLILFNDYYRIDLAKAWTLSLTLLAAFQWFNAWNCRSETESVFSVNPFSNKFLAAATVAAFGCQLVAVYNPFFQRFLHTVPLSLYEWLVIISFASSILLVEEIRKWLTRRNQEYSPSSVPRLQASQS